MGNQPVIKKVSWAGEQLPRGHKGDNIAYGNGREVGRPHFGGNKEDNRRQDIKDYRRQREEVGSFSQEERRYQYDDRRTEMEPRNNNGRRFYGNQESSIVDRNSGAIPKHERSQAGKTSVEEQRGVRGEAPKRKEVIKLIRTFKVPKIEAQGRQGQVKSNNQRKGILAISKGGVDHETNRDKEWTTWLGEVGRFYKPIVNHSNGLVVTAQVHYSKDDDPELKKWASSKEPSRDLDEINVASCAKDSIEDGDQKVDTRSMEERSEIKTEMNKIKQAIMTLEQT